MPHYDKAPITEAVIDIRVDRAAEKPLPDMQALADGQTKYPNRREIEKTVAEVQMDKEGITHSTRKTKLGSAFTSDDEKQVFQARSDGFTFSRLAPYQSWEPFQQEAKRLWTAYREIGNITHVSRVAVRTINRIDMPLDAGVVRMEKYLRSYPEVPETLGAMGQFFMRLQIPVPSLGGQLVLTQAQIPPDGRFCVSIVLDTDLWTDQNVPQGEDEIWAHFRKLHEYRNQVFESCITDESRALFQ